MAVMHTRVQGGPVVVALRGELDVTCAAEATAAVTVGAAPGQLVIVDLAGLHFIDCAGLRALAAAQRQARQDGGDVLLAAPDGLVRRLLALTGLDSVLDTYPSVTAARAAVPADARAPRRNRTPPRSPWTRRPFAAAVRFLARPAPDRPAAAGPAPQDIG